MGKVARAGVVGVGYDEFEGQSWRNFKSVCTSMPIKALLNDAVMFP